MIILGSSAFNKYGNMGMVTALSIGLVFFVTTTALTPGSQKKYLSPDETANYLIVKSVAEGKGPTLASPLTSVRGIVGPRSLVRADGTLLPGSFLGMPLFYGFVARVLGVWVIPFLTPFFSALALVTFLLILRRFMPERIAVLSTVLLAIYPAFWYYSSRGLYHNALLLDFALIGTYAMLKAFDMVRGVSKWRTLLWYGAAGLTIGFAVAVRTSEVVWLGTVILALPIAFWKKINFKIGFWVMAACATLPMAVVLHYNNQLFGQPFSFGYSSEVISTASASAVTNGLLEKIGQLFFPFGIHVKIMAVNAWNYGIRLFWMPALLSLLGLLQAFRIKKSPAGKLYLAITLFVSAWLIAYYGSWVIQDNPDPNAITIGTSYTRYWLSMYALALPFAAYFISSLADRAGKRRTPVLVGMVSVMALSSVMLTVLDKDEGLAQARSSAIEYRHLADRAVAVTPQNAVIIAGHADKVFFPERSVIVDVSAPQELFQLRTLMEKVPVFVYVPAAEAPVSAKALWQQRGFGLSGQIDLARYERLFRLTDLRSPPSPKK